MEDIARLKLCEAIIRDLPCPHPASGDRDGILVAECMEEKHCGCSYGVACGYIAQPMDLAEATGYDPHRDM